MQSNPDYYKTYTHAHGTTRDTMFYYYYNLAVRVSCVILFKINKLMWNIYHLQLEFVISLYPTSTTATISTTTFSLSKLQL